MSFYQSLIGISIVLASAYYYGCMGSYQSYPYQSTVYIEPSSVTEKIKRDGRYGVSIGWSYLAFYSNPTDGSDKLSIVWYLATPSCIRRLTDEAYYNKPGAH